jgi:predicted nicotinamide N-methyase
MSAPELDADGDAVVARRRPAAAAAGVTGGDDSRGVHLSEVHLEAIRPAAAEGATASTTFRFAGGAPPPLALRHALETPLAGVGLQVWAGALLLTDWVSAQGGALAGAAVLELGAGTGLAALAAAHAGAARVFATDTNVSAPVLELAAANAAAAGLADAVSVRRLDWAAPPAWLAAGGEPSGEPSGDEFGWTAADLRELSTCALVVAADCIYDDCLTEAFMRVAAALLRRLARARAPRPRLVVALERRVVFALADLAVRAPAYDYWRTLFSEEGAGRDLNSGVLVGRRLDAGAVPRRVLGHARGEGLELWELWEHDV